MKRTGILVCGSALALAAPPAMADGIRICCWNVTSYSGSDTGRNPDFEVAFYDTFEGRSLAPDIILGQEFETSTGVTLFRNMLNNTPNSPGDWAAAAFSPSNPPGAFGNAFFYRTSKVQLLNQVVLNAGTGSGSGQPPRVNNRYHVRLVGYSGAGAEMYLYGSHMKAGSSSSDQDRRTPEAQRLVDDVATLPAGSNVVLGADLNIQSSSQLAYQILLDEFSDPILRPGNWNNSGSFRIIHTQAPAGGGGMDDRFDQILLGDAMFDDMGITYLPDFPAGNINVPYSSSTWDDPNHSYRCWGNDGSGNGTSSLMRISGNTMVGTTIAQALFDLSEGAGHLPVFLNVSAPAVIDVATSDIDFGTADPGATAEVMIDIGNIGNTALWGTFGIDDLTYTLSTTGDFSAPAGTFSSDVGTPDNQHAISMDTSTGGPKSGTLIVDSDDPDNPQIVINLTGSVGDLGEVELRVVVSDDEGTSSDTGPVSAATSAEVPELYVQARIVGDSGVATGLTAFNGRLSDDLTGSFAPAPLTFIEALGLDMPGLDPLGRTGMFPFYRSTIANDNNNIGNGQLSVDGTEWLFLPLDLNATGNGEGIGGAWSNIYKFAWSSPDDTPRTVTLNIGGLSAGYQSPGGLVQPVPVLSGTFDIMLTGSATCPCDFDGQPPVDVLDLLAFLGLWFAQEGMMVAPGTGADYDANGTVEILDLLAFLSCWFPASDGAPCP